MKTRRIAVLEECYLRHLAAEAGAPYGLTADQVLEDAGDVLSLPPEVQPRELEALQHDDV